MKWVISKKHTAIFHSNFLKTWYYSYTFSICRSLFAYWVQNRRKKGKNNLLLWLVYLNICYLLYFDLMLHQWNRSHNITCIDLILIWSNLTAAYNLFGSMNKRTHFYAIKLCFILLWTVKLPASLKVSHSKEYWLKTVQLVWNHTVTLMKWMNICWFEHLHMP